MSQSDELGEFRKVVIMIFKRRDTRLTFARLRDLMIPRKGWGRAIDYIIFRVKRLPDSPHKIAIGLATGVFCSFTPFFGLHIFLAILIAYLCKGNVVAAFLGTFFGNPITWPFIASFSVGLGQIILGYPVTNFETFLEQFVGAANAFMQGVRALFGYGESDWDIVYIFFKELFVPYFVGGFFLGLMVAGLSYFVFRPIIFAYKVAKAKKRSKLSARNLPDLKRKSL